jgi:hypothetical protein
MSTARETMAKFAEVVESPDVQALPEGQKRPKSNLSKTRPKAVKVEPMTIKLDAITRRRIFEEVARRKADKLPNRTIQAVVADAIAKLIR